MHVVPEESSICPTLPWPNWNLATGIRPNAFGLSGPAQSASHVLQVNLEITFTEYHIVDVNIWSEHPLLNTVFRDSTCTVNMIYNMSNVQHLHLLARDLRHSNHLHDGGPLQGSNKTNSAGPRSIFLGMFEIQWIFWIALVMQISDASTLEPCKWHQSDPVAS